MMTDQSTTEEQSMPNDEANEEQAQEQVEQQLSEVDQLTLDLAMANEAKLRALADFKNYQRRSLENETRAVESGVAQVVRSVLPAIEQMNLAIEHAGDDAVVQGFQMALDSLLQGLFECGISVIDPSVGDVFDPQMHEAMMRQDSNDLDSDQVLSVMQKGFKLEKIVLAPAKVIVSS